MTERMKLGGLTKLPAIQIGGSDECCPRFLVRDRDATLLFVLGARKWSGVWVTLPFRRVHSSECKLLHQHLQKHGASTPTCTVLHRLRGDRIALYSLEAKMALPLGLAPRTSSFAGKHAISYTLGAWRLDEDLHPEPSVRSRR